MGKNIAASTEPGGPCPDYLSINQYGDYVDITIRRDALTTVLRVSNVVWRDIRRQVIERGDI